MLAFPVQMQYVNNMKQNGAWYSAPCMNCKDRSYEALSKSIIVNDGANEVTGNDVYLSYTPNEAQKQMEKAFYNNAYTRDDQINQINAIIANLENKQNNLWLNFWYGNVYRERISQAKALAGE